MSSRNKPPVWFTVATVAVLIWNLIGAFACIQQFRLGADAMGPATPYDRQLHASMPGWYDWCFAFAEAAGVAGAAALLVRHRVALPLFVLSLVAAAVQFGYLFAASDIIAVKGVWTTYFPLFVLGSVIVQIWLARRARTRGWIG